MLFWLLVVKVNNAQFCSAEKYISQKLKIEKNVVYFNSPNFKLFFLLLYKIYFGIFVYSKPIESVQGKPKGIHSK
jgi:hypothetical protein